MSLRAMVEENTKLQKTKLRDIKGRFKRFVLPNLLNEPYNAHP
jgi:hypothetical protein